ncbi:hypothetical protein GCM10008164_39080 [Achromobacter xylosoxidans]|nr:hypothetical protein GCM10008164_39080 [Achromobacter xylosoxidans]
MVPQADSKASNATASTHIHKRKDRLPWRASADAAAAGKAEMGKVEADGESTETWGTEWDVGI